MGEKRSLYVCLETEWDKNIGFRKLTLRSLTLQITLNLQKFVSGYASALSVKDLQLNHLLLCNNFMT